MTTAAFPSNILSRKRVSDCLLIGRWKSGLVTTRVRACAALNAESGPSSGESSTLTMGRARAGLPK
jgi:hypothetical protein